jgi:ABC-type multidrug transport system fused ATPase/permease subunit
MRAANCDGFVSRLDGGIQYQVGRNGSKLSGGQRQRLGLARALLADPIFLVLDEPASALDSEGETAVIDAVQACRAKNRALLIITHRAKTLSLADRVIVLKEGAVVQEGDLANLKTNKNGELASLMPDLQSL